MQSPSVMFVHAHPDDEALWTGGTIARTVDSGASASVVTGTWEAGTRRFDELADALDILGAGPPLGLGYADAGFPESAPAAKPLCESDFDAAVGKIVGHIRSVRPDIVVTYDAYGIYGHPEHIRVHRLTCAAVEAAACGPLHVESGPPWQVRSLYLSTLPTSVMRRIHLHLDAGPHVPDGPAPGTPADRIDVTLDVSRWRDRKWAAIRAHRSELDRSAALKLLVALDDDRRDRLLGTEWFLRRDLVAGGAELD